MRLKRYIASKAQNEHGNILLFTLTVMVLLFIFIAFAVDITSAYVKRTEMQTIVQVARDANLDTAILTRNSETPAKDVAENLTELIRANGFNGEVSVTFYELSTNEIGNNEDPYNKRVWCTDIKLSDTHENIFLGMFGFDKFDISVRVLTGDENEATTRVWKPARWGTSGYNGIWTTPSGEEWRDLAARYTSLEWNSATNYSNDAPNCPFSNELLDYVRDYALNNS